MATQPNTIPELKAEMDRTAEQAAATAVRLRQRIRSGLSATEQLRRHPDMAVGLAFAGGLALGRVLLRRMR